MDYGVLNIEVTRVMQVPLLLLYVSYIDVVISKVYDDPLLGALLKFCYHLSNYIIMILATFIEIFYLPIMAFTVYHLLLCDFFVDFFLTNPSSGSKCRWGWVRNGLV